jgi:hypothetical protein
MDFWQNTWSNVLGGIGAGLFFLVWYLAIQWFLRATDLAVGYSWQFGLRDGVPAFWPAFDIRSRPLPLLPNVASAHRLSLRP